MNKEDLENFFSTRKWFLDWEKNSCSRPTVIVLHISPRDQCIYFVNKKGEIVEAIQNYTDLQWKDGRSLEI